MSKNFNQAPLPFQGQKRKWKKVYQKTLLEQFADKTIFVDLFGGSGLLSYFTKQVLPNARVIYNDFDNYSERLENVDKTNTILEKVRVILKDYPKEKRIVEPFRSQIIDLLKKEKGFVDYITLSSSLMFSMNYATKIEDFEKDALYSSVRQSNYVVDDYLNGLEIVNIGYKELYQRWAGRDDVVFLIDPPYLSTDVGTYSQNYWKLKDYLDVLHTLKNTNYFYFTSNKSSIVELCEWLESNYSAQNPFNKATKILRRKTNDVKTHFATYSKTFNLYRSVCWRWVGAFRKRKM